MKCVQRLKLLIKLEFSTIIYIFGNEPLVLQSFNNHLYKSSAFSAMFELHYNIIILLLVLYTFICRTNNVLIYSFITTFSNNIK